MLNRRSSFILAFVMVIIGVTAGVVLITGSKDANDYFDRSSTSSQEILVSDKNVLSAIKAETEFHADIKYEPINIPEQTTDTQTDGKTPQQVIETFFKACSEKNIDLLLSTITKGEGKKYTQVGVFSNQKSIKLLNIDESKATIKKKDYMEQHPKIYDVRIFWIEFDIEYIDANKSVSGKNGKDEQNFILVKTSKESPWLINGRGF